MSFTEVKTLGCSSARSATSATSTPSMSWRCFFSIDTTSIAVQPPMPISTTSIGREPRLRPPTSGAPSMVKVWPLPLSATNSAPSTQEILAVVDMVTPLSSFVVPSFAQKLDDAVEGARFLLGHLRALQQGAQVEHHRWPHVLVAQEARLVERALEMVEQVLQLFLGRRPCRMQGHALHRRVVAGGRPFVGDQQHGLRHVERGERSEEHTSEP